MKKNGLKSNILLMKLTSLMILSLILHNAALGQKRQVAATLYDDGVHTCNINILYDQVDLRTHKGVFYYWYRNGHINFNSGNYSGNLLHGQFEKFSYSGSLKEKGSFKLGTKDGNWQYWNNKGEIQKEERWEKGFLKCRRSWQNDTVTTELFRNNKLIAKAITGANDKIISMERFRKGTLVPAKKISLSGTLKKVFRHKGKDVARKEQGREGEKQRKKQNKKKDSPDDKPTP